MRRHDPDRWLLDTNACVHFLNGSRPLLVQRVLEAGPAKLAVSTVSLAELHFGAECSARSTTNAGRVDAFANELVVVPFDADAARSFGSIKAALRRAGTPIGDFDAAIAATALARGWGVVSCDGDMEHVPGLVLQNWSV